MRTKTRIKTYIYFTKEDKKKFLCWLIDNDMNQTTFAKKCGIYQTFIHRVINGETSITDKARRIFKKGGYEI